MEDKLEMRNLNGQDLFPMLKILSKVRVKDMVLDFLKKREEFSKARKELSKKKTNEELSEEETKGELSEEEAKEIGMEVFADIIDTAMCNLDLAKDDINKLLASLCNVKIDEVKNLGMMEYTTLVMNFFAKEELSDFFKCISSSSVFKNLK